MADLTPERLQELRRIAEAATPGPPDVSERCHEVPGRPGVSVGG